MTVAAIAVERARLRVVLLALLPTDGTRMTVQSLAKVAGVAPGAVTDALFSDWWTDRIGFDVRSDSFWAIKQGSAL